MRILFESRDDVAWISECLHRLEIMMGRKNWILLAMAVNGEDLRALRSHKSSAMEIIVCELDEELNEAILVHKTKKLMRFKSKTEFNLLFERFCALAVARGNQPHLVERLTVPTVAIVLVCHAAYLSFLSDALWSIDNQTSPATEKVLLFDGCVAPSQLILDSWRVICGKWGSPNPARNIGISVTTSEWIVFWDADNIMPTDYIESVRKCIQALPIDSPVGFLYPDLQYCDHNLRPTRALMVDEFEYWNARECTSFDTSAAWRRTGLEMVGGWNEGRKVWDDFCLVLRLSRLGWEGKRLGRLMFMREHFSGIRRSAASLECYKKEAFEVMSFTILSLLAGRESTFDDLIPSLMTLDVPSESKLILVDNSGSESFGTRLAKVVPALLGRFKSVRVDRYGDPYRIKEGDPYLKYERHLHVAAIYANYFREVNSDRLLTVEDDMIPPKDGLRKLSDVLFVNTGIAAAGGAYRSANHSKHACAALDSDRWENMPVFDELPNRPIRVNYLGGGFTLYNMAFVKKVLPIRIHKEGDYVLGWDGCLSKELRKIGKMLWLHGGVRVIHNAWGVKREERNVSHLGV